jgi:hypothetical protein
MLEEDECTVLWYSGAQVSLVTHQYAEEAGFGRQPASIRIMGVGAGSGGKSSVQYRALLRRRDGSIAEIMPYRVDKITGYATSLNLGKAKALFPSNILSNIVLIVLLFQENTSFGASYHLHSSSDVLYVKPCREHL